MKPADYLFAFRKITEEMCALTAAKNKDYATDGDSFSNFRIVEHLGICPVEVGIITRLSDKLARVSRLLHKDAAVKTESVEDTLLDMAVYSIILLVYLRQKETSQPEADFWSGKRRITPVTVNVKADGVPASSTPHAFYSSHEDDASAEALAR